jgi:hypothetical protein
MVGSIHLRKTPRTALFCLALAPLLAGCADASGIVSREPAYHVALNSVESEAQLIDQLRAAGYHDILVTPLFPTTIDVHGFVSPVDPEARTMPAHFGWNGWAVKDGQIFDIYVDRAAGGR